MGVRVRLLLVVGHRYKTNWINVNNKMDEILHCYFQSASVILMQLPVIATDQLFQGFEERRYFSPYESQANGTVTETSIPFV